MILLALILAAVLAISIARYNCSNKLFWILFVSFMAGITVGTIGFKLINGESKEDQTEVSSSQVFTGVPADSVNTLMPEQPTPIPAPSTEETETKVMNDTTSSDSCGKCIAHRKLITPNTQNPTCYTRILTQADK